MSYSDPLTITYWFGEHDFGAGGKATSIKGPKGRNGRLMEITAIAAETFNQVTTPAYIRMGTTLDADAYAEANLGALADTDTFVATADDTDAIIEADLPKDTQLEVAFVAPTGGTPAGIATVGITIEWA